MVNFAKPLITSRFVSTDFKKCCVLNSNVVEAKSEKVVRRSSHTVGKYGARNTRSLAKARRLKKI